MTTKKEQEKRAKLEVKIGKAIQKICENKPSNIRPKKWGFVNDHEIELVYWRWYFEDKKLERLMVRIMNTIRKKFDIEVSACADTTEQLNWHYV
ncbi:hypothetical protein J6O86_03005 [bacterium]|nr:hypothetical protein [bacterium]